MFAGFGKANVTPDLGTELTGYGYYLERKALPVFQISIRDLPALGGSQLRIV